MGTLERIVEELQGAARVRVLADGEVLLSQGDEADEVFFLRSGQLVATVRTAEGETEIGRVDPGGLIGEVTVVIGGRRTATLRAAGAVEVVGIPRADFEHWLLGHPDLADDVVRQARQRVDQNQVAAMVVERMGATDPAMVREVVERVEWRHLEPGEVLFRQGDVSDAAYFVVSGRLLVVIAPDGDDRSATTGGELVREIGRGEVVGELGLLDRAPRSGTVRAIRETTLAAFPSDVFEDLVQRHPALLLHVARGLVSRTRRPTRKMSDRAASIAVAVVADDAPDDLVDTIVRETSRHGRVTHLSSGRVDDLLGRDGIAQADDVHVPRLNEFLHETDLGNDHVILEADRELTAWSRRALRQSDRTVLVVSPDPGPAERRRIRAMLDVLDQVDHVVRYLAVLHPPGSERPRGTAALVDLVGAARVVHVRHGSEDDVRRLARLVSGHGVGLVLSGGGARGFAHIGVYRAIREAGIPIDAVGGCSIGAPLAAGVGLDVALDDMEDMAEAQFHRLLDYTIPVVSVLKGRRITRNIEANFGGWDIEDLWVPFYCVSTNLTSSRLEVHRRGPVTKFVRASVAIPGVLPPVPHEGDLLVDGGVLNNLPVTIMSEDGSIGTVIAVDVAPPRGPRAHSEYGPAVSGWRALLGAVTRRGPSYPRLFTVLLRSMLTGAVHNQREEMRGGSVDLLLTLTLPGVGLLEFDRVRPVAKAGYESVKDTVSEWAATQRWLSVTT